MYQCPNGTQSTHGRICRSARSSFFPDETTAIDNENANYLRSKMTKPLSIADIFINVVSFGLACTRPPTGLLQRNFLSWPRNFSVYIIFYGETKKDN